MRIWVEVTSGDRAWLKKINGDALGNKRGLKAPASTRYLNMLRDVEEGDVILTYLTLSLTRKPEWRSSIIGISTATSRCYKRWNTLLVDTDDDLELPVPIKYFEFRESGELSEGFRGIINRNMQKYLFKVEREDLEYLIGLHKANAEFLRRSSYSRTLG